MKIEKNNANLCFFKDVEIGECFEYDGNICLRTRGLMIDGTHCYNVVALETGIHRHFDDNDKVIIHKNAKVVIE